MHRNNLIKLLEIYQPTSSEKDFKDRMINFIKSNPNCFNRELETGHITASSWLLNKTRSKALLMHHRKLDKWLQLGGHADGETNALSAAIKEAQEESGIPSIKPLMDTIFDIDIHKIPENSMEKTHYHYDIRFILQVTTDDKVIINKEAKSLLWFGKNISKLPTKEESIIRMFNKWISCT